MLVKLQEFTIGIESELVTLTSPNYCPPSWPPPRDWPVVLDKNGLVVSRWGDTSWNLAPWAGHKMTLNFNSTEKRRGRQPDPLDAENAELIRIVATWLIWGPHQPMTAVASVSGNFHMLKPIFALCSRNGINANELMRFPKVFEQVPGIIAPSNYERAVALLHRLYDARDVLGFTVVDPSGLRRMVAAAPDYNHVQTPYIPPRIWLYQITRLRECLVDFYENREQIEALFNYCLKVYVKRYGSLEAALVSNRKGNSPFHPCFGNQKDYPGKFIDVVANFGLADILTKWVGSYKSNPGARALSHYFSVVTFAGLAYTCNFTLQRKEEVASLRMNCLVWEQDEKLGRVPIICGETTKTEPDSDARWVTSPSVDIAIQTLSIISRLRMIFDSVNPAIKPTAADQQDPYLASTATEPWADGLKHARPYHIRRVTEPIRGHTNGVCSMLFDREKLKITAKDLEMALRLTPNLPREEFAVGSVWPLAWHQYRRTGAVNMFSSGDISDSTMQQLMKHSTRLMPLYYGRNHGYLHLNKEVQVAVVMAMYQAQAETLKIAATDDRFISPHGSERRDAFSANVLSVKDTKDLINMAKKGLIAFREHRLGGCMKAGICEYGGIESIARCAGGDGGSPCADVLYDRNKELRVRTDIQRVNEEIKVLSPGHPRTKALREERRAMENFLNALSV